MFGLATCGACSAHAGTVPSGRCGEYAGKMPPKMRPASALRMCAVGVGVESANVPKSCRLGLDSPARRRTQEENETAGNHGDADSHWREEREEREERRGVRCVFVLQ